MIMSAKRATLACALLATTCLSAPALAQSAGNPSIHKSIDENGVDLTDGSFNFSLVEGSIGSGPGGLALMRHFGAGGEGDNVSVRFNRSTTGLVSIVFGNSREEFASLAGDTSFEPLQGSGATLTKIGPSDYRYTDADGTVTTFGPPPGLTNAANNGFCSAGNETSCQLIAISTTAPNGTVLTYQWDVGENCFISGYDNYGEPIYECAQFWRQRGLSNNFGYRIRFSFQEEENPTSGLPGLAWHTRTGATLHNDAVASTPRNVSYSSPASGVTEISTDSGRIWRLSRDANGQLAGIRRPGSASDNITVGYAADRTVGHVTADGVTTQYNRTTNVSEAIMTVTNALGHQRTVTSDLSLGRPSSMTDEYGQYRFFEYDPKGRLTNVVAPEINRIVYSYDARGNVTETRAVGKTGSGPTDIVTRAAFATSCANVVICNKPLSTTDANGNVTEYSYDPTHGGLLSVTLPAAPNGVRPQTRYSYGLVGGIHMPTGTSACRTQASCAGTSDEVKTSIAYGANNLPTTVSTGAGDGSLTASQAMSYDPAGNLLTVNGPLAGTADTIRFRYNEARERIGTISPDPDGAGPLKHRAVRTVFSSDGQVARQETGTVASQSDADWGAMSVNETAEIGYDANSRPVTGKLIAGGAIHAMTQTSYDALGRPECTAQRMNPGAFGSLPASACSLGAQGSFGPDRISRTSYDRMGRVSEVRIGVGTADEAVEVSTAYTPNGQVASVADAENNKTSYEYDIHDRLSRTFYPVPAKGAGTSSTTDFEQQGYDAASNVTSFRNRAGEVIGFSYDALNRLTLKDLPGAEPDVSYGYDLLGRMTSASQSGHALSFSYDALGRKLSESGPHGTVSSQYDIAGRRTRLTHPDGFAVFHDYLVTGEMTQISLPSTDPFAPPPVLVSFGYDDLGRRTSLSRANGAVTNYSYDPVSRLSQLVQNLGGTTHDLTLSFSYNPASQITSNTRSNDAYAWTGHGSGMLSSPANGLNQLVSHGGGSVSHDAKGNVTYDPTKNSSFGYSSENLLTSVTSGSWTGSLGYDPLMRLYQTGSVRNGYDGEDRIAEYNASGTQTARYVHGPAVDEPLIEYGGSGLATRRFLHADERGSIVATSNDSGGVAYLGRFDEYGRSQSYASRFGYAGMPIETLTYLYYARARMYNPDLPRFMQPDPIRYGGGMNLYAYPTDPVNFTDPMGLNRVWWASRIRPHADGGGGGGGGFSGGIGTTDAQKYGVGVLWERTAWFSPKTGEQYSDWKYTGRYFTSGSGGLEYGGMLHLAGANSSPYISDENLPPYAHILRGRRVVDPRTGNVSLVNIPRSYRLIPAPRGGGYLLVPPRWTGGSTNIVRIQPAGTGSVRYNPNGYFVVYGQSGAALNIRTGQQVSANSPEAHNPLGGVIPPLPFGRW